MNASTVALSLLLSSLSSVPQDQEFNLAFKAVPGEKLVYGLSFDIKGLDQSLIFKAKVTNEVVEKKEDGQYIIASYQSDHSLLADGTPQPVAEETITVVTTYDAVGQPVTMGGDQVSPESYRVANLTSFIAHKQAVKVGQEWAVSVAANKETGAVAALHNYKFIRLEKIDDVDVAVIEFQTKETSGNTPASLQGTVMIDPSTGRQLKYTASAKNLPIGPNIISGKIELTLLKN